MNYGWLDPKFWVRRQSDDAANVDPFEDHVGDVWNYGRLDPNLGVRRQSDRCSQCGSF